MKFTKEQVLNFSTNWKKFHRDGKHKKQPKVVETGLPPDDPYYFKPQIHMISPLKFHHHMLYNYLRNLPIERGINLTRKGVERTIRDVAVYNLWFAAPHAANYAKPELEKEVCLLKEIFGEEITLDIFIEFRKYLYSYKYQKVVDNL